MKAQSYLVISVLITCLEFMTGFDKNVDGVPREPP